MDTASCDLLEAEKPEVGAFPPPREFQSVAHEALRQGVRDKHRCQLLMASTGSGKTYLGMRLISEALKRNKRALFVCDRRVLVNQTSAVADSYGLRDHGIHMADHWRYAPSKMFQIASVQTLARRKWPEADLIIIDECHCMYSTWTDHVMQTSAVVIGLSATAFTPGLGKIFTNLINAATMDELVQLGVLVPMKIYSCTKVNMKGAATLGKNGEWTDAAAGERGMEIVGDVVSEWSKLAAQDKTIVFGATIAHCEELCKQFNEAGVMAAVYCSTTTDPERESLLAEYRKPDSVLRVLISVAAISRGFDVPDVGCICDVRPLRKSLSEAMQMWGRGMRSSPGKSMVKLLDFSGNIHRFRESFEDIYFNGLDSLDMGEKLDKTVRPDDEKEPPKGCPKCGYKPFTKHCMACGYVRHVASTVEHEPGRGMQEIILARDGKTKLATDHRHLYAQIATYVRRHGTPGKKEGWAKHLYAYITGQPPPRHFNVHSAPEVPVTAGVMGQIRRKSIAFAKGMERRP